VLLSSLKLIFVKSISRKFPFSSTSSVFSELEREEGRCSALGAVVEVPVLFSCTCAELVVEDDLALISGTD